MANNLTNYAETETLKWLLNLVPDYSPVDTELALYTSSPGEAGGGTEVNGGSYARTAITWGSPASGAVSNASDITFPTATGDWGTIVAAAIWDEEGDHMLWWGPLAVSKTIATGEIFKVLTGNLTLTLD